MRLPASYKGHLRRHDFVGFLFGQKHLEHSRWELRNFFQTPCWAPAQIAVEGWCAPPHHVELALSAARLDLALAMLLTEDLGGAHTEAQARTGVPRGRSAARPGGVHQGLVGFPSIVRPLQVGVAGRSCHETCGPERCHNTDLIFLNAGAQSLPTSYHLVRKRKRNE